MLHLFLMLFDKVFEVLTMVRIDNAVWVRTLCHLVRGYWMFWRSILGLSSQVIRRLWWW